MNQIAAIDYRHTPQLHLSAKAAFAKSPKYLRHIAGAAYTTHALAKKAKDHVRKEISTPQKIAENSVSFTRYAISNITKLAHAALAPQPVRVAIEVALIPLNAVTTALSAVQATFHIWRAYSSYKGTKTIKKGYDQTIGKMNLKTIKDRFGLTKYQSAKSDEEKIAHQQAFRKRLFSKTVQHSLEAASYIISGVALAVLTFTPIAPVAYGLAALSSALYLTSYAVNKISLYNLNHAVGNKDYKIGKCAKAIFAITLISIPAALLYSLLK